MPDVDATKLCRKKSISGGVATSLWIVLVSLFLVFAGFILACTDDTKNYSYDSVNAEPAPVVLDDLKTSTDGPVSEEEIAKVKQGQDSEIVIAPPEPEVLMMLETGPTSLNERIVRADLIVRATLASITASTPQIHEYADYTIDLFPPPLRPYYVSTLEMRFEVHEYLKGTGEDILAVDLPLSFDDYYSTEKEATDVAELWISQRDTRWDNREAIIFVQKPIKSEDEFAQFDSSKYIFLRNDWDIYDAHGYATAFAVHEEYIDTYSIRSRKNKVWLPSTSIPLVSGASGVSESSYYLEEPPVGISSVSGSSSDSLSVSNISLSDLKSRIKEMNSLVKNGEGVEGYRKCIEAKFSNERFLEYEDMTHPYAVHYTSLESGLPSGSVLTEGAIWGGTGSGYSKSYLVGPDGHLFEFAITDNDNHGGNGYLSSALIKRPLPEGAYEAHYKDQHWVFFPCGYIPDEYSVWNVDVTAPEGTLHEAFFDPVDLDGGAVGAGGENGVLKKDRFLFKSETSIERIEWKDGEVVMEFKPHRQPPDHHIDFIALDGSVSLRLDFDEARKEGTGAERTLVWGVCEQPWKDGDLLMIRMSESEAGLSGATNDGECADTPPSEPETEPTATPNVSTTTPDTVDTTTPAQGG